MHVSTPLGGRAARWARGVLPSGQLLAPEEWERRHRGIVVVLWLHVVGLTLFGVSRGLGLAHCVAMLDLDHFKLYNDRYGQVAGDQMLKEAVAAWSAQVRSTDLLARYGGEEFGVLLPSCPLRDAIQVVDRLRLATPTAVTCSVGLAVWDFRESALELIGRADQALYAAEADGRNRSVTAGPAARRP